MFESLWQPLDHCSRAFLLYKNNSEFRKYTIDNALSPSHRWGAHSAWSCCAWARHHHTHTHMDIHDLVDNTLDPRRHCPPCCFLQEDKPNSPNPAPTPAQAVWLVNGLEPESPDGPDPKPAHGVVYCPSAPTAWQGSEFIDIDAELNWDRDEDEDEDSPQEHLIPWAWVHQLIEDRISWTLRHLSLTPWLLRIPQMTNLPKMLTTSSKRFT